MGNRYKIPFELGTWAGLVAFGYFLVIWLTPFSPLGFARFGGAWIPILFLFVAVYRQMKTNGPLGLTFGNAFMTGITTVLALGLLKATLVFIMLEYVDITLIDRTHAEYIQVLERMRSFSPDQSNIDEQIQTIRDAGEKTNAFSMAAGEINLYFMGGIPVALLAALIFNRKPENA